MRTHTGLTPNESPEALRHGRPGLHDPTTALGGTPALSPLTLRLKLATFGLVVSLVGAAVFAFVVQAVPVVIAFLVVAATSVVDIAVIQRRRHRGEPG
jgi:hypothetical protein